jgi:hypothetical protein
MSYYILPKINNILSFNLKTLNEPPIISPYISSSLIFYYCELLKEIKSIMNNDIDCSDILINEVIKSINPYEYIFSKVPGTKYSVSKLKSASNLIYDLLEILNSINVLDKYKEKINCIIFSSNNKDINECIALLRDETKYNDNYDNYEYLNISTLTETINSSYHFIYFDSKTKFFKDYLFSLMQIILFIIRYQIKGGNCIIKIHTTIDKPIIDIIYILTTLYDKTYIVKPNTNNIATFEKYIVCKDFCINDNNNELLKKYYNDISNILESYKNLKNEKVYSLLDFEIPCYFINKLDDINIIIGQQQLETFNLLINILKNKNREEKLETIRKTNIHKCILWCEKFGIPHNKFNDKTNIFLPNNNNENKNNDDIVLKEHDVKETDIRKMH